MKRFCFRHVLGVLTFAAAVARAAGDGPVAFPGPQPGTAGLTSHDGRFVLENSVIACEWTADAGGLRPVRTVNKITGERFEHKGASLFRLAVDAQASEKPGVAVAVRLDADRVVALTSKDGLAWTELASYPRGEFPGEPKIVRVGKMNLKAQAKDHAGDAGPVGACAISELSPKPRHLPDNRIAFNTGAHKGTAVEYEFPAGTTFVSCRIDKGTDQGESWGPALALVWADGERFLLLGVRGTNPVFNVTTADGERIMGAQPGAYPAMDLTSADFRLDGEPRVVRLVPQSDAVRVADHTGGMALEATLISTRGIRALLRAELRDGANYVRTELTLSAPAKTMPLRAVEMVDLALPGAKAAGSVPGCPAVTTTMFCGLEMPGAQVASGGDRVRIGLGCTLELAPGRSFAFGAVQGVAPAGQMRRAFLCYVERERARPSKPFLHYNCWYDLGFSVNASNMMDVVTRFDRELVKKRGVPVQSYLVDDGWDDVRAGLWAENDRKFPGGFAALKAQMEPLHARMSIWISPLGGYGGAPERTALAAKMGLIPQGTALDLAQPAYKQWFQDRCLRLMREGGVNAFKWDKAGDGVSPHFMALLDVARNLRRENPSVFINVTVGTWPSPFWLNHVDSTWRNGSADVGWSGKGDDREKWITFRDGNCREYFVRRSPLYPLNSVMHHGIVHGRCFQGEKVGKSGADLKNEARSYFAAGATLQELYLTPSMMTDEAWDRVAEAAKWGHANADVLLDAHWVGGDPLKLEPYGYAACNPRKGTLMLRNPDDKPQTIDIDVATVFELPADAPRAYKLASPYADQRIRKLSLTAGISQRIELQPFEVLVFDATAK